MSNLADHIETIDLYVKYGYRPGSCTTAILANDLVGAVSHADAMTELLLGDIVRYIVNSIPRQSWGSYAAITAWMREKQAPARDEG